MTGHYQILGVILAGGGSTRMGGGDKAALPLGGKPLIKRVRDRLAGQVAQIVIAGGHGYGLGLPNIPDCQGGVEGPVAGIAAVWRWAKDAVPEVEALLTVPADTPFLPTDVVAKLARQCSKDAAIAFGDGRLQPAFGYWPMAVISSHADQFDKGGWLSLKRWAALCEAKTVSFEAPADTNAFRNINTPEDLAAAEAWLSKNDPSARSR